MSQQRAAIKRLMRALEVAEERALMFGEMNVRHGGQDNNRAQFKALVADALKEGREALKPDPASP